ncbi:hypothetical protein N7510_007119 [Penicillium lagena]|uniref:uncharacterized protein n=1 Tax=Penicillium lagena TaxID=94218 RepID=UPI00253FE2A8|nr:uncharacterized protein N7510_007119 [Penicillium lagena]KAJ5610400.1 hypothetical protein N7510_007119 [Penicillium lagena]
MMIVESAINVAPDNSGSGTGNYWYAHPSSAPYLMKNGTFAEEIHNVKYNILSGDISKIVLSSAVAAAWIQQNVFVAKRTDNVHDTAPCDIDLDKLDGARVCDGDTAYFFMVSQSINSWGDYAGVSGTSKIDDYGLDLLTMAKSAEWISDHHDGYFPQVSPTDIVKDFTYDEGALENGYFIELPFMDADDLDEPSYWVGGSDLPDEVSILIEGQ